MTKQLFSIALLVSVFSGWSQESEPQELKYRRSSLYTVMTETPTLPYADEIKQYFIESPIPDKFNDHNLPKRVYQLNDFAIVDGNVYTPTNNQQKILNDIARDMVAKWFNRSEKGGFEMSVISKRGSYDASAMDIATAKASKRGVEMLADAGEELIGKTFVLINEFKYVNKEEVARKAKGWLDVAGVVGDYAGISNASTITTLAGAGATVAGKGYVVKTQGHLYQLVWDEQTAAIFYEQLWADDATITPEKKKAFDESTIFKLKYIGTDNSWADVQSSIFTNKSEVELVERATMKAMDAVIVKLQKAHDQFKTKNPLYTGEPITAKIGLKEGLTGKSTFEVVEQRIDENGKTNYVSVGTVRVDDRYPIWDNRFGADEENPNSAVDRTYFKKLSGGTFYPGMLLVQKGGKNFNASRKNKKNKTQVPLNNTGAIASTYNNDSSDSEVSNPGSWGIKAGLNNTNYGGDWAGSDDPREGFFVGFFSDSALGNFVHLQFDFLYSQEGSYNASVDYLSMPIMFKFYFSPAGGVNIQAGTGFSYNISTGDEYTEALIGGNFDMKLGVGLGYDFGWGILDARYNFGILDINQNYTETGNYDIVNNNGFSVGLGIKF